ncbi:cAMP-dependent protein kinase inhibitor beta isoform X1 [Manis pentadactyla]|uniref:cAMP-dependent protein kinase inhibitor beta isoform X1 n=1 Tax=Manis pentadactyla TaxID=143292 RepID=UPI001873B86A|nr:cAMP-dependent protein kinase inhibitor beta isoform X1 [Manis pentadactyla]
MITDDWLSVKAHVGTSLAQGANGEEPPWPLPLELAGGRGGTETRATAGEPRSALGGGSRRPLPPPPESSPPPGCAPAHGSDTAASPGAVEVAGARARVAALGHREAGLAERQGTRHGGRLCTRLGSWCTEKALHQEKSGGSWKPSSY